MEGKGLEKLEANCAPLSGEGNIEYEVAQVGGRKYLHVFKGVFFLVTGTVKIEMVKAFK